MDQADIFLVYFFRIYVMCSLRHDVGHTACGDVLLFPSGRILFFAIFRCLYLR